MSPLVPGSIVCAAAIGLGFAAYQNRDKIKEFIEENVEDAKYGLQVFLNKRKERRENRKVVVSSGEGLNDFQGDGVLFESNEDVFHDDPEDSTWILDQDNHAYSTGVYTDAKDELNETRGSTKPDLSKSWSEIDPHEFDKLARSDSETASLKSEGN